ncbi:MFS transporter [Candidatus Kuenenbacteria bacterium]|nr:MFS transporter [Candidatus Kuenenbacteria bacterium]
MNNKISKTIRYLILSDFFLFFAVGLLSPIFAVFVLENIENKIEVIGFAVACYWITRVVMVMPISRLMDKIKGEADEYSFMVVGTFLIAIIPLFYALSSKSWHIYFLQALNGFANAMAVPAWRIIFTKNIDKKIVGFEWSLEDVGVGIATALSAAIGAIIADKFGFNVLFVVIAFFGIISATILLILGKSKRNIIKELMQDKSDRAPLKLDTFK